MSAAWFSRYVRVNGVKTHYVESGEGEPLILVHGGGPGASGEHNWRHNIPALASSFRVLAIDLIGFGLTDKPPVEYSEHRMVEHLAGFIDALCLEKVRLAGNSMGAYVTTKYALDHPEQVQRMLMVSTGTVAGAMGLEMPPSQGLQALSRVRENLNPQTMRQFLETIVHQRAAITDELVESRVRVASLPGTLEAQKSHSAYRLRLRKDPNLRQAFEITDRLPRVTIPLCLVWGKQDRFAPVELGYRLKELLPNLGEFHVLEHSGHQCQNDEIERFNEIALRFFRS